MKEVSCKKKVLVIIPRIPYPINSGGRYATYETLKILAKHFDVSLVVINDEPVTEEQCAAIKPYTVDFFVFTYSKYQCYLNVLGALFRKTPLQVSYFYYSEVQSKVDELLAKVDFCYTFTSRTAEYVINSNKPVAFNAIDSMYLNYKKSVDNTKSFFWKIIYQLEIKRLFSFEKNCVEKFKLSLFVNKQEGEYWKEYGNSWVIPFGIENEILEYNNVSDEFTEDIVFLGRMDYQPNIDAVQWFSDNCLSLLNPNIKLLVVGGFPTTTIKKLEEVHSNVVVKGFVDDPYVMLKSSLCVIAPMQTGGGLQTKILMSMAVGSIVLSSTLSIQAIGAKNREHLIVEDDAEKFAKLINDIYENRDSYQYLKNNARDFISENFSWSLIEKMMIEKINLYILNN